MREIKGNILRNCQALLFVSRLFQGTLSPLWTNVAKYDEWAITRPVLATAFLLVKLGYLRQRCLPFWVWVYSLNNVVHGTHPIQLLYYIWNEAMQYSRSEVYSRAREGTVLKCIVGMNRWQLQLFLSLVGTSCSKHGTVWTSSYQWLFTAVKAVVEGMFFPWGSLWKLGLGRQILNCIIRQSSRRTNFDIFLYWVVENHSSSFWGKQKYVGVWERSELIGGFYKSY